jgi:hypothetical protein
MSLKNLLPFGLLLVMLTAAIQVMLTPAFAQTPDWTTAKTADLSQLDQVRYAQLTPDEKTGLQTLTAAAVQACATTPADAADTFQRVRARRTDVGAGTSGFVVEGSGCLCTPQGNCAFWLVTEDMHVLFQGLAQSFALTPNPTIGLDLITATHISTTAASRAFYTFDGTKYQPVQCADISLTNPFGNFQMKPTITLKKCQ